MGEPDQNSASSSSSSSGSDFAASIQFFSAGHCAIVWH
jgi:hypothetical protein